MCKPHYGDQDLIPLANGVYVIYVVINNEILTALYGLHGCSTDLV